MTEETTTVVETVNDENNVEEATPKKSTRKKGTAVKKTTKKTTAKKATKKTTKKKTTKKAASKKPATKKKVEKGELADHHKETLKALKGTKLGGDRSKTRKELRKETGNHNLGLPFLISEEYVGSEVIEGKRSHSFAITAKGTAALRKL